MACKIPYIENQDISEGEKTRLEDIHVSIFKRAIDSKLFSDESNKLVAAPENKETSTFVSNINNEYGEVVATLKPFSEGNMSLTVNVLPLIEEEEEEDLHYPEDLFFAVPPGQVEYSLKAVNILQSKRAEEVFKKGTKNNWSLEKIMSELAIPKDQQEIIKNLNTKDREEIITSILASHTYTVEINTSNMDRESYLQIVNPEAYYSEEANDARIMDAAEARMAGGPRRGRNNGIYSNLTVPGGTNYEENEIATPGIVPAIQGHAKFATQNGIGWFRSDDQNGTNDTVTEQGERFYSDIPWKATTRRILEVQSDLFQKGRDREELEHTVGAQGLQDILDSTKSTDNKIAKSAKELISQNSFLQLLNKDNNWVSFFIKSIVQDSAKRGYTKVLFPSGDTASKVEGHQTLTEFKKNKERRIAQIIEDKARFLKMSKAELRVKYYNTSMFDSKTPDEQDDMIEREAASYDRDLTRNREELANVERNGFESLRPIYHFYETVVANVLKKNYDVKNVTDEYGNTWNEISITPTVMDQNILLQVGPNETKVDFNKVLATKPIAEDALFNLSSGTNIISTGSLALSTQGSVYRDKDFGPHDLDFIARNTSEPEVDKLVFGKYPGAKKAYSFNTKVGYKVLTYIVSPKGTYVDSIVKEKGKVKFYNIKKQGTDEVVGDYTLESDGKEASTGVEAVFVDMFLDDRPIKTITYDYITSDGRSKVISVLNHESTFEAKQKLNRPKDISDAENFSISKEFSDKLTPSIASPETLNLVKNLIKNMGATIQDTLEYSKGSGLNLNGVRGVADLTRGIIAIAEGQEGIALTEEMIHVATSIMEQSNPALVTEMISKIDRFSMYERVKKAYQNRPEYQLPNGKPDIRKIKKEAVDRLLAEILINKNANVEQNPELRSESQVSIIERMWQAILDFFKGEYRKANIDIFEQVTRDIEGGKLGTVADIKGAKGVYLQTDGVASSKAVDDMYNLIMDRNNRMKIVPQTESKKRHYLFDEKVVAKSVTEKVKESQNMPERTPEQAEVDDQKRQWGTEGHEYIANFIDKNLIDSNGYRLPLAKNEPINTDLDRKVAEKLKIFARELIASYPKGTRFLAEKKVINERAKGLIGSTMDFIAIEPNSETGFKMDILDWKFMSINKEMASDVPWYKQKEWNSQMGEYAHIMYNYGVKTDQLRKARMIPFQSNYIQIDKGSTEMFKKSEKRHYLESIEIGDLNTAKETKMYLLPVPLATEITGEQEVDALVKSLREYHKKLYKTVVNPEDYYSKTERLNEIASAIRSLHIKKDFVPLVSVATTFLNNSARTAKRLAESLNTFDEMDQDKLDELLGEILDMQESSTKFKLLSQAFTDHMERHKMDKNSVVNKDLETKLALIGKRADGLIKTTNQAFRDFAVHKALKEGVTTEDTKLSILNPEVEVNAIEKTFLEGTKLSPKIIRLVSGMIMRTKSMVVDMVRGKMAELTPMLIDLQKEASAQGKSAFELIGTEEGGQPTLIKKIEKEFQTQVWKARKDRHSLFLKENMDMSKYRELADEAIRKRVDAESRKHYPGEQEEAAEMQRIAIRKIHKALDIEEEEFNGFNDYDFVKIFWASLKEGEHLSKEYKAMSPTAKKVWEFFTALNVAAKKLGYLGPKHKESFFPLIEASIIEKVAKGNGSFSTINDILKDTYTVRADETYNYSKVDEETNELEKEIPRLFTLSRKDSTKLTTDLNKVAVLWLKAVSEYEATKHISNTALVLHNVEKNKGRIITSGGSIIWDGGKPKVSQNNTVNASLLMTIIDDGIFGLKENLSSIGNVNFSAVVGKLNEGKTEEDKRTTTISGKKIINNMNRLTQSLAVGLKLLVAIPNYVGGHMQAFINAGRYYKAREFEKNNIKIATGIGLTEMEKAVLHKIAPLNEDIGQEAMRELGLKQGLKQFLKTWTFHDVMMVTNSYPDRLIQYANAMSFIDNTMVVDGHLVNIRQYLAKEDRKKYKTMSYTERRALEQSFEERVSKLKEEKSLSKVAKIEDNKVVIPGVSEEEIARYRVSIIEQGRNISGQMSQNNKADYRRDTILKSFMMFRGWIPKQVSLRTLDIQKNTELDQWEYGRTRVFIKTLRHLGLRNIDKLRDILLGTDEGMKVLKDMYDLKKQTYKEKTGQDLEITEEEFYDMIRDEIRNQFKELAVLIGLVALVLAVKAAEPPEEEGKAAINRYKFWLKAANKIADELWFYYNPMSAEAMTRGSILPALGLTSKVGKFLQQLEQEVQGHVVSDQEMIEKSHPQKYFLNLMPIGHQVQNEIMPLFYPEWAKEQGIRVTSERAYR